MKFKTGRNKLFLINKKHLYIAAVVIAAVAIIIVVAIIVSSTSANAKKHAAISSITETGMINVGLRGNIGSLCTYDEETGSYSGLEKDVVDEIIKRTFKDGIIVNYVNVDSETKDALLLTGELDISLGASVKGSVSGIDYSRSFYSDALAFLVMEGETTSIEGLAGGTIAIVQGSPAAEKNTKNNKITNIQAYLDANNINAEVKTYASYPEAVEALRTGKINCVCINRIFIEVFGRTGMLILRETVMPVDYCIEIRDSLGAFSDAVNDAITSMQKDGTMDELVSKWGLTDYSGTE